MSNLLIEANICGAAHAIQVNRLIFFGQFVHLSARLPPAYQQEITIEQTKNVAIVVTPVFAPTQNPCSGTDG